MTNLERWRFYTKDIESPDIFIDWTFYSLVASALQRRVWLDSDPLSGLPSANSRFPNFFIVFVAPPATGKSRSIAQSAPILKSDKMVYVDQNNKLAPLFPTLPDSVTTEGLSQFIAEHCVRSKAFEIVTPNGEKKKRAYAYTPCSFMLEEIGVLFRKNQEDVIPMLCQLYDSRDFRYKTKRNGDDDIKNVCVNMLAGTITGGIKKIMQMDAGENGLTSRMIVLYEDKPRFTRLFEGHSVEQQRAYNELFDHIKALSAVIGEVKFSPEARAFHKYYYESGKIQSERINRNSVLDYYYGRKGNLHWPKLAMVLLYADQTTSNIIQVDHMQRALDILAGAEVRMHEAFISSGRNETYEENANIIRLVKDSMPQGIPRNKLWWKMSSALKKIEFEECMELLITTRQLTNESGVIRLYGTPLRIDGERDKENVGGEANIVVL